MKKYIALLAALALCVSAGNSQAQTTTSTNEPSLWNGLQTIVQSFGSSMATNFAVVPYATYAPDAPTKFGGGVLGLWNINNNVGAGMGVDYLGQLWMPSADVQLKVPIHPLSFVGLTNFTATPFVIGGVAIPLAGAKQDNRGVAGIAGAGAAVDVCKLWGGEVSVGGAAVEWSGAGDYSGRHFEGFLAWRKGF